MNLTRIQRLPVPQLQDIYFQLANEKLTGTRKEMNAVVWDELKRWQKKPIEFNKRIARMPKRIACYFKDTNDTPFGRLTAKERWTIVVLYRIARKNSIIDMETLLFHLKASEKTTKKILKRLKQKDIITIESKQIILRAACKKWAEANKSKIKEPDMSKKDFNHPGKRSKYCGMRIRLLVDDNPRQPDSWGWHSWKCMHDGMTFEEYKANGGRTKDLDVAIDKGWCNVN